MILFGFSLFGQGVYSGIGSAKIASTDTFNIVSMKYDKTQNLYVLGSFKGTLTVGSQTITGAATTTTGIGQNLFLAKYSSDGTLLWLKNADRANPQAMTIDNSGNVYVAGKFFTNAVFGTVTLAGEENKSYFTEHIFAAKYDATGNVVYAKQYLMNGVDIGPTVYTNTTNCTETQQTTRFYNKITVNDLVANNAGELTLVGSFTGQFMSVRCGSSVTSSQYQTNLGTKCGVITGTATTTHYDKRAGYKMTISAAGESLGVTPDLTTVYSKLAITPAGVAQGVAEKIDKGNSTGKYDFSAMNLNSNIPSNEYIRDIIALNDSIFYVAGNFRGQLNHWNTSALVSFIARINTANSSKFKLQVLNNDVNVDGTGASFLRITTNAAKDKLIVLGGNKCDLFMNDNAVNTKKSVYLTQFDLDLNYKWSKFAETSSELILGNRPCALSVNANDEIFCAGEYLGTLQFGSNVLNSNKMEVFFSKYKYASPAVVPITISNAEYFYDTDPGVGKGIAIPGIAGTDSVIASKTISTAGLTTGFHNLFVRFKYNNGQWSMQEPRIVYVIPSVTQESLHQIIGAEYFFDTDPGKGNGVSLGAINQADSISLSKAISAIGISKGFHNLYVRTKDNAGVWSMPESRMAYVQSEKSVYLLSPVTKVEYFIDQLPVSSTGLSGIKVTKSDSISLVAQVPTTNLTPGFHTLYFRAQDSTNVNGLYDSRMFYIQPVVEKEQISPIVRTEYFFNTDPGVNKGILYNSYTSSDSISISLPIKPIGLQNGENKLYVRAQNSLGVWSHTVVNKFTIDPKAGIENLNSMGFEIYPNPTSNNIRIRGIENNALVQILDINGKMVLIKNYLPNETINVSNLTSGVYLLRISTPEGIVEKRLLKK